MSGSPTDRQRPLFADDDRFGSGVVDFLPRLDMILGGLRAEMWK